MKPKHRIGPRTIVVEISGGVAFATRVPKGTELIIRESDNYPKVNEQFIRGPYLTNLKSKAKGMEYMFKEGPHPKKEAVI